ncbi:MAG TPA: class III extradiol ring-cleavage dioxygenase [Candidatus Angelobacter sp.]|nr:class III extradiol ring-cleavage dioxygenase [Candidatus Angelobacter sp.]
MNAQPLPALFLSHGSPMLVFEDIPARHFIAGLGREIGRPQAILCISAHWETERPAVSAAAAPETIHDFYGFPDDLYKLRYPVSGAPALARRVVELLDGAGIAGVVDPDRGLDHGAWNPLLLIYPQADVPVTQLSIQAQLDPTHHAKVGRALRPLRGEGVLVLASGGAVHNLRQFHIDREQPTPWAVSFDDWLADRIAAGDAEALLAYRQNRPDGRLAHPRDEHLLPLFVAMGAGGGVAGRPLHRSFAHGSLSMAAFAWG